MRLCYPLMCNAVVQINQFSSITTRGITLSFGGITYSPPLVTEEWTFWHHLKSSCVSALSPAHTVRFWPRFARLRQILKILKDSYNPRLKSVDFDRWFDMFTDSRLMAVAIKFHLRQNSGSVRRFGEQSCSVTTPTMNVKLSPLFKTSYEQN